MNKTTRGLLIGLGGAALAAAGAITGASLYFYHLSVRRNEKRFLQKSPDLPHMRELQDRKRAAPPSHPGAMAPGDASTGDPSGQPADTGVFSGADGSPDSKGHEDSLWLAGQPTEAWSIISEDGLSLSARWMPAAGSSRNAAILAHGYSSRGSEMAAFARLFHELGFHVLMPDARGHGDSGGDYIGFGWHDRLDILQWTQPVISRVGEACQLVLFGISMGGATVLMAGGEPLPAQVRAIIEDCGYTSAHDQLAFQLKRMYHLPATPLIQTTSLVTRYLAGYGFEEASALEQVKLCQVPILFIHGTEDTFVPTAMAHELYEACTSEKELFLVEGAGHGMAYRTDPEGYRGAVSGFLDKHLNGVSA
jgi:hypothetical protein